MESMSSTFRLTCLSALLAASPPLEAIDRLTLTPFSCCDGQFTTAVVQGERVWRIAAGSNYLYFNVPSTFTFQAGSPVYVEVTYLDEGEGTVALQYDSTNGNALADFYVRSEAHTRSTRVQSGAFVRSYHQLLKPKLAGRQNGGADFRLAQPIGASPALSVRSVVIQNSPFDDPQLRLVITKPWLAPYSGPSRDDVDRNSLRHKVMVGYQGWFRTPNDLADEAWIHWCRNGVMIPENFTIDMWPPLDGFYPNERFRAGQVMTQGGQPAFLFSSTTPETVRRHFRWMRQYGIDGAFLQRFATRGSSGAYGHQEWVLQNVREAANLEGRIWAIAYDVSALTDSEAYEVLTTDWKWLVDTVKVVDDSRYALEGGKPVVFIWGLPFPDRGISLATADAIVDFFKSDPTYGGNYVVGGWPWWWRTINDWYGHFQKYHGALAWMPQDQAGYQADLDLLRSWGIDDFPHVWPGFSWANLQRLTGNAQFTPRSGGSFFWQKIRQALGVGAERLYVGMFDEYDEGTAVMPMSDDPPSPPPSWGRFITNEGRPADWWMLLTGQAREMLLGRRPTSSPLPTETELANRSDIGPEAWADLGQADGVHLLRLREETGDGNTVAETFAGRDSRRNQTPGTDLYFYFDVDPSFADADAAGLDVTIEVEYLDSPPGAEITLEYDSVTTPYQLHPKTFTTQGTEEWRTVRFEIADAFLGGRQNAGSDFRVRLTQAVTIHLDRVRISKDSPDCDQNGSPDDFDIAVGAAEDIDEDGVPDVCETGAITPGDANGDGSLDVSDALRVLLFLFEGFALPCGDGDLHEIGNLRLIDWQPDGALDLSDAVAMLGYLFLGGTAHSLAPPGATPACPLILHCPNRCGP
jgi:hypothetical protein